MQLKFPQITASSMELFLLWADTTAEMPCLRRKNALFSPSLGTPFSRVSREPCDPGAHQKQHRTLRRRITSGPLRPKPVRFMWAKAEWIKRLFSLVRNSPSRPTAHRIQFIAPHNRRLPDCHCWRSPVSPPFSGRVDSGPGPWGPSPFGGGSNFSLFT